MRNIHRFCRHVAAYMAALALISPALGQPPSFDPTEKKKAIEKLDFLVGEWKGEGWMAMGPDQREDFQSWERVEPKVGATVLLVEGLHTDGEAVVHDAMAVISWDEAEGRYLFSSHLADGRNGDFPAHLEDGAFVWRWQAGSRQIRYTIRLDDEGRWFERGEMSTDGEIWRQFFEMRLAKVDG